MTKAPKKAVTKTPKKAKKTTEIKADTVMTNEPKADPQMRALAVSHRDKYAKLRKRMGDVQKDMRLFGKKVKSDGLTMRQIKLMVELSTPEGEAAFRMNVANDLIAAQYQGAAIGQQLALFLEPDRTPAVDKAYQEGVKDCVEGKAARSPYDPSLPQSQSYLTGFADEQERRLKTGITKLEPAKGYIPMTADELANQQAEAAKAGGDRSAVLAAARKAGSAEKMN